jgi:Nucleotide-diphospho-sugar transferase.
MPALLIATHVFVDDWFLPSLKATNPDIKLILEEFPQECLSGDFMSDGWRDTMFKKIDLVIRGIKENKNKVFIHSDVNIQYLLPIKNEILSLMSDKDILIQRDTPHGGLCAGFFACKGNKKTLKLFEAIKAYMHKLPAVHDQLAMNYLLRTNNEHKITWDYLPSTYMGGGTFSSRVWEPGIALGYPRKPAYSSC